MRRVLTRSRGIFCSRVPFWQRHVGTTVKEQEKMLSTLGYSSMDSFVRDIIPDSLLDKQVPQLPPGISEAEALTELSAIASKNKSARSFLGSGVHGTTTPPAILRNVLENPRWYTPYTPYQAEVSQGRLQCLLTYQQVVEDLTGFPCTQASLLDDATAVAEAIAMAHQLHPKKTKVLLDSDVRSRMEQVVRLRASGLGLEVITVHTKDLASSIDADTVAVVTAYPGNSGVVHPADVYRGITAAAAQVGTTAIALTDPLALVLLESPAALGFGIAIGTMQRFGVPMGGGGPHAAYIACSTPYLRMLPGRIIGLTRDKAGNLALRMTLQTREQHIRRHKASSNICTAQALLANVSALYAVYHGPKGLRSIAEGVAAHAVAVAQAARDAGLQLQSETFFDTVSIEYPSSAAAAKVVAALREQDILVRLEGSAIVMAFDETTSSEEVELIKNAIGAGAKGNSVGSAALGIHGAGVALRSSAILTHEVFSSYQNETGFMRYVQGLCDRDMGLTDSMIPLGSCTMKLNAAAEMLPISWPSLANVHPLAPKEYTAGYQIVVDQLCSWLSEITGLPRCFISPNSGAQGEYAGLVTFRNYFKARGEDRNIILIPSSAHGTNPASCVISGLRPEVVACEASGDVCLASLQEAINTHGSNIAGAMVTYPSTHGVFEPGIQQLTSMLHDIGAKVYIDGANMNAMVGYTSPGVLGGDICHLNLHKTFCIPHGGGGPGMGPICMTQEMWEHCPEAVTAYPHGSALVLIISWMYIRMMGLVGMKKATESALLHANYLGSQLTKNGDFHILYKNAKGRCAHEFILDTRPFKKTAGVSVDDIVKRLLDYGIHGPTMSFPVANTLMVEPTESEPLEELDRFIAAMQGIRKEIAQIENQEVAREGNILANAPHTAQDIISWGDRYVSVPSLCHLTMSLQLRQVFLSTLSLFRPPYSSYSMEKAFYPGGPRQQRTKFWPTVNRIDDAFGDRSVILCCPPLESYCSKFPTEFAQEVKNRQV